MVRAELTALETPEQAGRSAGNEHFEAIFVDPSMARFSRQGFTCLVRTSRLNSEVPIVLLSGDRVGTLAEDATTPGVTTMATPLRSDDILPYLQKLVGKLLADRRKNRRLAFRTGVVCLQGLARLNATSTNVSAMGIQMEMRRIPKIGEEMELHFQLELRDPIFHGRAWFALKCLIASRSVLRSCTEMSGCGWAASATHICPVCARGTSRAEAMNTEAPAR